MDLRAAMDAQLATLQAGGVRAVGDPRSINPPCLLVLPPSITWRMRCLDAAWTAYALATDPGTAAALSQLGALLAATQDALGGALVAAVPTDVTLPDGAGIVPGYQVTWTSRLPG